MDLLQTLMGPCQKLRRYMAWNNTSKQQPRICLLQSSFPRCKVRKPFLDQSGSMCTSYSSMGSGKGSEDDCVLLFCIYLCHQFKMKVPLLVHENVTGFISTRMADLCAENGYKHMSVKVNPSDLGIPVGRPRRLARGL